VAGLSTSLKNTRPANTGLAGFPTVRVRVTTHERKLAKDSSAEEPDRLFDSRGCPHGWRDPTTGSHDGGASRDRIVPAIKLGPQPYRSPH